MLLHWLAAGKLSRLRSVAPPLCVLVRASMLLHACSHIDVCKVPGLGFMNHADILISPDHCGIRQLFACRVLSSA